MKKGIIGVLFVFLYLVLNIVIQFITLLAGVVIGAFQTAEGLNLSQTADVEILLESAFEWVFHYNAEILIISNLLTLGAFLLILHWRHIPLKKQLGKGKLTAKTIGGCIFLLISMNIAAMMILSLPLFRPHLAEYSQIIDSLMVGNPILVFLSIGIIAPIVEEFTFRGMIFREFRSFLPAWASVFLSAALFGLMHGNVVQSTYTFFIGLVLAAAYEKTNSFAVPVLLHIAFNSINFIPSFLGEMPLLVLLMIGIAAFVAGWSLLEKKRA